MAPSASAAASKDNSLPTQAAKGNTSFVLQSIDKTSFEQRDVVAPKPGEVQVNVRQTGICGSDVHYWKHGRIGDFVLTTPMVLGHESAGIVTAIGEGVTTHKVGDRVALEPGIPCRSCRACKAGTYNICPHMIFAATPPYNGTLATYYNLDADFAHPVPDNMTLEEASLMEPLGVAVYAAAGQGQVRAMQTVVVFGAGPVGLLTAAVCKAYGAKKVVVVDVVDSKLSFASSFCATDVFKPSLPKEGESKMDASSRNARALIEQLGGDIERDGGVDLVMECTGAEPCVQMACFVARQRGRIVQVGMGNPAITIPITHLSTREVTLTGSFRYGPGTYPTAIDLVSRGLIDVKRLVTHRYAFDDALKAFEAVAKGTGEDGETVIKVQICQGEAGAQQ